MVETRGTMNRRYFLYRSAYLFAGSILGLNSLSRAFASEKSVKGSTQSHIGLIIDDIGFSRFRTRQFLDIGVPLTFAVLPRLRLTHILAEEIHNEGHEIMLHQPMEPYDPGLDPGPGAIYVKDETNRIIRTIEENISDTPFISGVNNHMGSRFTARQKEMNKALMVIKEKNLFFVDSLTTSRSMAYKTAKQLHMAAALRDIFLDNIPEEAAILSQLNRLKRRALTFGHAIGIGHPYPETARAIKLFVKDLKRSDISLVNISRLIPAQDIA